MNSKSGYLVVGGALAMLVLAGCSSANVSSALSLVASAEPCYAAVKAATSAANAKQNLVNGAAVVASNPACKTVDADSAALIAAAVNQGVALTVGTTTPTVAK